MNNEKITGDFLSAIQKYADKQKQQIESELLKFKQAELQKAEDEGLEDAFNLIQKEIADKRAAIKTELASKEQDSRRALFVHRQEMTDKIFGEAKLRLLKFAQSDEYKAKLFKSCEEFKKLFGDSEYTVFLSEKDMAIAPEILKHSTSKAKAELDRSIRLGGARGLCKAKSISADATLDALLEQQYSRFTQTSTLKVV